MAVQFALGASLNWIAMIVAAVIQAAAPVVPRKADAESAIAKRAGLLLLVLSFVSVFVARYAFYAACTF